MARTNVNAGRTDDLPATSGHGGVPQRGLPQPRAASVRGAWVEENQSGELVARFGPQLPTHSRTPFSGRSSLGVIHQDNATN